MSEISLAFPTTLSRSTPMHNIVLRWPPQTPFLTNPCWFPASLLYQGISTRFTPGHWPINRDPNPIREWGSATDPWQVADDERVQLREHGARIRPAPPKELLGPLSPMWYRVLPCSPRLLHPDHQQVPASCQRRACFLEWAWQLTLETHPDAAVIDRREGGYIKTWKETKKAWDVIVREQRRKRKGEGFKDKTFFGEQQLQHEELIVF